MSKRLTLLLRLSSPLSLYLSVSSALPELADIFSASFIYALFHQYGVLLAKCQVKLSLKIRDEFISLSLTFPPPLFIFYFFCCLHIFPIPSRDDFCSPCMQRLTNGLEISWLERMESRLAESESMARLKLTLSRITLYTIFPLHLARIMNFGNRTQYVLFMIREAAQYKMNIFRMKCIPISSIITLQRCCLVLSSYILCGYEVETKRWRERSAIYYSIRPKSFPGNEHTLGCDIWDPLFHVTAI